MTKVSLQADVKYLVIGSTYAVVHHAAPEYMGNSPLRPNIAQLVASSLS